jgi:hypothetical protein
LEASLKSTEGELDVACHLSSDTYLPIVLDKGILPTQFSGLGPSEPNFGWWVNAIWEKMEKEPEATYGLSWPGFCN